ncbi:MAG: polysaccharide pyruvyl transferase family protein [Opitutales bacterium]
MNYANIDDLLSEIRTDFKSKSKTRRFQERIDEFNKLHPRRFQEFLQKHIPNTNREYDAAEMRQNPPFADAYIVGSDNVWASVNRCSFLDFAPLGRLRIAYAVSAPWNELSAYWHAKARKSIAGLHAVSVREVDGIKVCRELGRTDSVQVLDPTLLLEARDYRKISGMSKITQRSNANNVLAYFLNIEQPEIFPEKLLRDYTSKVGGTLQVVPLQGTELCVSEDLISTPDPTEWLEAIDRSRCVVTNSFHGMVFSIIFRKPFIIFPQIVDRRLSLSSRFSSLLTTLGIENRVFRGQSAEELVTLMNQPIDWEAAYANLRIQREKSLEFLLNALKARK